MPKKTENPNTPLTFFIEANTLKALKQLQQAAGFRSLSQLIQTALENFDFNRYQSNPVDLSQFSVRIPVYLRKRLTEASKQKKASIGELIRASVESILTIPPQSITQTENTDPMAKKTVKKAAKKAAVKKSAPKASTPKKASVKKTTVKKAAKKAVKKVAKKAVKKAAKKATAKKVVTKTAKKAVKKAAAPKKTAAKKATKKTTKKG